MNNQLDTRSLSPALTFVPFPWINAALKIQSYAQHTNDYISSKAVSRPTRSSTY